MNLDELRRVLSYDAGTGEFRWLVNRGCRAAGQLAGSLCPPHGYLKIRYCSQKYSAHRLAWLFANGEWPDSEIDHINGDIVDNRLSNLRCVSRLTNVQNQRDKHINNSSGFMGVHRSGRRWAAQISVNYRKVCLGRFDSAEEAHIAYVEAKRRLHEGCTI